MAQNSLRMGRVADIELIKKPYNKTAARDAKVGVESFQVSGFKNSENREALLITYTQCLSSRV